MTTAKPRPEYRCIALVRHPDYPRPFVVENVVCPRCDGDVMFTPATARFSCVRCTPPVPVALMGKAVAA
jgi:ribosomal protein S27AE